VRNLKKMIYRGLKWKKFKFTVTPNEFENLFNDLEYFIAITNTPVDENYQINDKTSIFSQYQLYYNKIISGTEWKNNDWKLDIHTALTDNIEHIKFERFEIEEDGIIKTFKRAIQIEPVINISPFSLQIDNKNRLTVIFFDSKCNSNIGLEISYPKEIQNLESGEISSTENFSTHKLYLELVKRIKEISKKSKAKRNNNLSKPNFWISSNCIEEVNKNVMIKRNLITLE